MRFSTVGVHETLLNDCEFRENRQSEEHAFLTGVYDIRFTGCTCVPGNRFDSLLAATRQRFSKLCVYYITDYMCSLVNNCSVPF